MKSEQWQTVERAITRLRQIDALAAVIREYADDAIIGEALGGIESVAELAVSELNSIGPPGRG